MSVFVRNAAPWVPTTEHWVRMGISVVSPRCIHALKFERLCSRDSSYLSAILQSWLWNSTHGSYVSRSHTNAAFISIVCLIFMCPTQSYFPVISMWQLCSRKLRLFVQSHRETFIHEVTEKKVFSTWKLWLCLLRRSISQKFNIARFPRDWFINIRSSSP